MSIWRALLLLLIILIVGGGTTLFVTGRGTFGTFDSEARTPAAPARSEAEVAHAIEQQQEAARLIGARSADARQILFGDLHVHTTISFDAFMLNLPMMGGAGAHPPADACDFARHCAALDFWSINDHAGSIHPDDWRNTIESIRQCNELSGDPANPDLVAFLGWEWTQAGSTPENHYGHKNVVLPYTDDQRIPTRPIAASSGGLTANPPPIWARGLLALQGGRFHDVAKRWTAFEALPECADGHVRELGPGCREVAATPAELFRKLDEWEQEALVIPHGTTWGIYTPPRSSWDKQLVGAMQDPERQRLIEVYSGHGNSEVYRGFRAFAVDDDGSPRCPEETPEYLPMCRRAGQLVEERCLAEGVDGVACAQRAAEAMENAALAGVSPHITVVGTSGEEWLDAGQCRDCFQPAFKYRPASSTQYIAALGNFEEDEAEPRRFRMGFIASSDIHTARAGTGYKEFRWATDAGNSPDAENDSIVASFIRGEAEPPEARTRSYEQAASKLSGLQLFETERTQSFLYTGGLVATHADGRDRESIWAALQRREVYGTSGPRILLWFDLIGDRGGLPMGSEVATRDAPIFRVRAVGSFEQEPGCPESVTQAITPEEVTRLCRGECYHPSDVRRPIERIEVVRIRPQTQRGEDIEGLIDDPWQRFDCPPDPAGCVATFVDPEYPSIGRDTVYYARVFEAPKPQVNGDPLACKRDAGGKCQRSVPCQIGDECLADARPRAWSSPIYVDYPRSARAAHLARSGR